MYLELFSFDSPCPKLPLKNLSTPPHPPHSSVSFSLSVYLVFSGPCTRCPFVYPYCPFDKIGQRDSATGSRGSCSGQIYPFKSQSSFLRLQTYFKVSLIMLSLAILGYESFFMITFWSVWDFYQNLIIYLSIYSHIWNW